jgi:hypothetical protein
MNQKNILLSKGMVKVWLENILKVFSHPLSSFSFKYVWNQNPLLEIKNHYVLIIKNFMLGTLNSWTLEKNKIYPMLMEFILKPKG